MRELLSNPALVIVLGIMIGVGVPVGIAAVALRRRSTTRKPNQFSKAIGAVRDPWKAEDQNLQELSKLVKDIQAKSSGEKHTD